jgi:hypothetical protein
VFDAVESGVLACIVPAICAAEVLVRPYLVGPVAIAAELQLPLVTGERRLARATGDLLVHDFA